MLTDQDTILQAQAQLNRCALDMAALASDVADSKTIKEFSNDRLKRAFSVEVERFLSSGDSAAAAEHKARASAQYGAHLQDLMGQHKDALRVIEKYDALKIQFEAARSLLSVEKAKIGLI
jgi:hypothetical protein